MPPHELTAEQVRDQRRAIGWHIVNSCDTCRHSAYVITEDEEEVLRCHWHEMNTSQHAICNGYGSAL